MNTAYSEEMRPPKELFSRQWFDLWNGDIKTNPWHDRIDETKKKLEDLEIKLRKKIWKSGGYTQDLLVDIVTFLNSYIGVWQSTFLKPAITPLYAPAVPPHVTMVYPHDTRVMSTWEEVVLGGVQRDGVCLSMLSPQCVDWLNTISDWVGE